MLGVQLFGQIEKHCVVKGTNVESIAINNLAIPDTHCSGNPEYGNQCPADMDCITLHLEKEVVGYNGFDHIGKSRLGSARLVEQRKEKEKEKDEEEIQSMISAFASQRSFN